MLKGCFACIVEIEPARPIHAIEWPNLSLFLLSCLFFLSVYSVQVIYHPAIRLMHALTQVAIVAAVAVVTVAKEEVEVDTRAAVGAGPGRAVVVEEGTRAAAGAGPGRAAGVAAEGATRAVAEAEAVGEVVEAVTEAGVEAGVVAAAVEGEWLLTRLSTSSRRHRPTSHQSSARSHSSVSKMKASRCRTCVPLSHTTLEICAAPTTHETPLSLTVPL